MQQKEKVVKSKKRFIQNLSYSFVSNILSLLLSSVTVMIVPKLIGVAEYGYYQLYVFYASYTGFFHFGWCDGIYLKYAGIDYDDYDRGLMSSQFWYLTGFEFIISLILIVAVNLISFNVDKHIILTITAATILVVIPKTLLTYFLQISNRIREYSILVVAEKGVYFIGTILLLLAGVKSYQPLIMADVVAKTFTLVLGIVFCKSLVMAKPVPRKIAISEAFDNTNIGIKLMFANIASMLILGIVRISIENKWSIEMYAKVSLAISISNLLLVFINAIGVVVFPMLKRISEDALVYLYVRIRDGLMIILFAMLLCYYPAQWILGKWLPAYSESFKYMSILFPMCIFESKMALLVNTYMKAMRKEKQLLMANLITVGLSVVFSLIGVYWLESVELTMVFIVVLFAVRCLLCETTLSSVLNLKLWKDAIVELIMCAVFMFVTTSLQPQISVSIYIAVYCIYLYYKKTGLAEFRKIFAKK